MPKKDRKGQITQNQLVYLIILGVVIVLVVGGYLVLKGKGIGAIEFIKNLFRFGAG